MKNVVIGAVGADPDKRAEGTRVCRSLHPHQRETRGWANGDLEYHAGDFTDSSAGSVSCRYVPWASLKTRIRTKIITDFGVRHDAANGSDEPELPRLLQHGEGRLA